MPSVLKSVQICIPYSVFQYLVTCLILTIVEFCILSVDICACLGNNHLIHHNSICKVFASLFL